jgi:hypothetical protein
MRPKLTPMTWFVVLTLIAIGLALGLPVDPKAIEHMHTSSGAFRLAVAVLLIPYVLIWYAAFYAYAKLQEYSRLIKTTKDGAAFHKIAIGMGALAFALVVPTIISLILHSIAGQHPSFKAASVITVNYLTLFSALAAFLLLFNGARLLLRTVRNGILKLDIRKHAPWFLLLAITFSHLTIENYYQHNPYHVGKWVLITTFIVPYIYTWMVGLLCAYELYWYAKTVKGLLYRRAIKRFAQGLAVVVAGSIIIQFVNITILQRVNTSLTHVLLLDYVVLTIVIGGLFLMALGTKKLKKIEEL